MKRKASLFTVAGLCINAIALILTISTPRFFDIGDDGWVSTILLVIGCVVIFIGLYKTAKEKNNK